MPPNQTPTPTGVVTPTPGGGTQFALSIGLDGIGSVGDNATPNDSSGSNKNPTRTTRNAVVQIYNATNNLVASTSGTVAYNSTQGIFIGNVSLGTNTDIQSGSFIVKVKSDGYLRRRTPGIQNVVLGQVNTIPQINLVTGDINGDNAINILDYNILISCSIFSTDNHATCNSNSQYATLSDLDDNGAINQFDYNLFLRELSVQNGD